MGVGHSVRCAGEKRVKGTRDTREDADYRSRTASCASSAARRLERMMLTREDKRCKTEKKRRKLKRKHGTLKEEKGVEGVGAQTRELLELGVRDADQGKAELHVERQNSAQVDQIQGLHEEGRLVGRDQEPARVVTQG